MSPVSRGLFDVLTRINWEVFGHLTLKSRIARPLLFSYVWRLVRHTADTTGRPCRELLTAVRYERGEIGGRPHFHVLVGGTKAPNLTTLCFQMVAEWKRLTGGARVMFDVYRPCGSAELYLTKTCGWSYQAARSYELHKFDRAEDVRLSASIFRCLRGVEKIMDRKRERGFRADLDRNAFTVERLSIPVGSTLPLSWN